MIISDKQYRYSDYQHDNGFYLFDNEVDYTLAHLFVESETSKSNMNKFLTNSLMKSITEQLSYKNIDEWKEKLSLISWNIPNNKQVHYTFQVKTGANKVLKQKLTIYF